MKLIFVLVLATLAVESLGHANGAPDTADVCESMMPAHGLGPQQSPSPFRIFVSHRTARPGDEIKVELEAPAGRSFRGFYVQARSTNAAFQILGNFVSYGNDQTPLNFGNCRGGSSNSVTHANNANKQLTSVIWRVPSGFSGTIRFQ